METLPVGKYPNGWRKCDMAGKGHPIRGHIIIFEHTSCRGQSRHIFNEEKSLDAGEDKRFNDKVSSFVVLKGQWKLYKDSNFVSSYDEIFGPGVYNKVSNYYVENDQISSLRCVGD